MGVLDGDMEYTLDRTESLQKDSTATEVPGGASSSGGHGVFARTWRLTSVMAVMLEWVETGTMVTAMLESVEPGPTAAIVVTLEPGVQEVTAAAIMAKRLARVNTITAYGGRLPPPVLVAVMGEAVTAASS